MKKIGVCSFVLTGFAALILVACTTNPVTGRKQLTGLVSPDTEMQLGLSEFEKIKQQVPISHDPALNAQLERVGRRLAAVAGKDMPNAKWEFVVFDSPQANAFCLPGGKVGVFTGILPITKDDAGLATVVGHEIGHAVAHHAAERMSQSELAQVGGSLIGAATGNASTATQQAISTAYGVAVPLGLELPFSRKQELEADEMGLVYMARAGYDPRASIQFWQRFAAYNKSKGGSDGLAFLRTHPLDEKRIAELNKNLPEAERIYASASKAPVSEAAGAATGSEVIGSPRQLR